MINCKQIEKIKLQHTNKQTNKQKKQINKKYCYQRINRTDLYLISGYVMFMTYDCTYNIWSRRRNSLISGRSIDNCGVNVLYWCKHESGKSVKVMVILHVIK